MFRLVRLASMTVALAFATAANAQTLPSFDQLFLQSEARSSAYELALAQLAQDHAMRPAVKAYADTLVQDHERQDAALRDLAAKKGVTLDAGLSPQSRAKLDRLRRAHGAGFDAAFLAEARRVNGAAIRAFRAEASKTTDPEIRQFVAETLPIDEQHDKLAQHAAPRRGMPVIKPPAGGRMPVLPPPSGGTTPVIPPPR
jgi:putative membrane protein